MPDTMNALRLFDTNDLREVSVPVPVPQPGEVRIRTTTTTICTSDLNDIDANVFGVDLPRTLGHEGAGIVDAAGPGVKTLRRGDRVAAHPVISCGHCDTCTRGLGHLCDCMSHLGIDRDGTFAEYFCIPADRCRVVPKDVDMASASLLEPVCVCFQALERGRLAEGEGLLIVGDGPFGITIGRLARLYGPGSVTLIGQHEFRMGFLADAKRLKDSDLNQAAWDRSRPDVAIVCAGSVEALRICIEAVRPRGRVVIFANMDEPTGELPLSRIHLKELEIYGSCNDEDYLDRSMDALSDEALAIGEVITHRFEHSRWREAFDVARNGRDHALKVAIRYGDDA